MTLFLKIQKSNASQNQVSLITFSIHRLFFSSFHPVYQQTLWIKSVLYSSIYILLEMPIRLTQEDTIGSVGRFPTLPRAKRPKAGERDDKVEPLHVVVT